MGANPVAVVLSRGEVGELVAEHLFEKRGLGELEIGRDADEVSLRVAAAEASGETRAPFDRGSLGELRGFPGIEPLVEGADGERNVIGHGGRLPRRVGVARCQRPRFQMPNNLTGGGRITDGFLVSISSSIKGRGRMTI